MSSGTGTSFQNTYNVGVGGILPSPNPSNLGGNTWNYESSIKGGKCGCNRGGSKKTRKSRKTLCKKIKSKKGKTHKNRK
jgi:hypothetical protein